MYKYCLIKSREYIKKYLPFSAILFPLPAPSLIVFFVTSQCNALCEHCFLPLSSRGQNQDISKENILKIIKSLNRRVKIVLTGGEPFLRKDLKSIVNELMDSALTQSIDILSNGSLPEEIESVCKEICLKHKKPLRLQLSLDGLAKTHDTIRKIPDGFNKVIDACERMKKIKQQFPQFSFIVSATIMKQNISEIEDLVNYLEKQGYSSKLAIVRGNSFSTFGVPQGILNPEYNPRAKAAVEAKEIEQLIEKISKKHPKYFTFFEKIKLKIILNTLIFKRRQLFCYAGYNDAVVYSNGDIGMCEQVKPFGNLSDWNWDLRKAWNSKEAIKHRAQLTSCACIHGCNIGSSICSGGPYLGQSRHIIKSTQC